MPRICTISDCNKRAGFGCFESTIYCLEHSTGDIVNFANMNTNLFILTTYRLCEKRYCKEFAEYNYNAYKATASFCENHINLEIRNYRTKAFKRCSVVGCNNKSEFGPVESSASLCSDCYSAIKSKENIEIIKLDKVAEFQTCVENKCKEIGTFGTFISKTPCLCEKHAIGSMHDINNKSKICIYSNSSNDKCKIRASYGYDGDAMSYCKQHMSEGMIDLNARKCSVENCNIQPVFGFENERAERCATHKEENMIDVRSMFCEVDSCKTRACYGFYGQERCAKHKEEGMVFSFQSQICREEYCNNFCAFGFIGERPVKCLEHKEDDMINVKNNRCSEDNCDTLASFGYKENRIRERCLIHKLEDMISLSIQYCKLCKDTCINQKYRPHCYKCFAELNPDHVKVIEYKTRENAFTKKLKEIYTTAILDKRISGGCLYRPDFLLILDTHAVIVEVDERQHTRVDLYSREYEEIRTQSIHKAIDKPLIVIRINPDNYRIGGKLIKGCFAYNADIRLYIVEEEYNIRLNKLFETVGKYIHMDFSDFDVDYFEEIFLFYSS